MHTVEPVTAAYGAVRTQAVCVPPTPALFQRLYRGVLRVSHHGRLCCGVCVRHGDPAGTLRSWMLKDWGQALCFCHSGTWLKHRSLPRVFEGKGGCEYMLQEKGAGLLPNRRQNLTETAASSDLRGGACLQVEHDCSHLPLLTGSPC